MNATKIMRGLWAGSFDSLEDLEELETAGLKVVVSVLPVGTVPCDTTATFIRKQLNARPLLHKIIIAGDDDTLPPPYIADCLSDQAPTLIHCNAGKNRSTAMAACWLLLHRREKKPIDALNRVARCRGDALGFPPPISIAMRENVMSFARWLKREANKHAQPVKSLTEVNKEAGA